MSKPQNFYSREEVFGYATIRSGRANATNTGREDYHVECSDARQFFSYTSSGKNKGGFTLETPGRISIEGGSDIEGKKGEKLPDNIGFQVIQQNGDIVISAENGRIKFVADSIEFKAASCDKNYGNIHIDAQRMLEVSSHDMVVEVSNEAKVQATAFFALKTNQCNFITQFFKGISAVSISEHPDKFSCNVEDI